MTDLIKKSWYGKILMRLGSTYRGYIKERERILTDQAIKKRIEEILENSKNNLFKVVQSLFKKDMREEAEFIDNICVQLDLFRNSVKNAEYGFHPKSQSLIKEEKEDYANIMKADASMIYYADETFKICSEIYNDHISGDDIKPLTNKAIKNLKTLKEIFQQRKDYVSGISHILEINEIKK